MRMKDDLYLTLGDEIACQISGLLCENCSSVLLQRQWQPGRLAYERWRVGFRGSPRRGYF